MEIAWQDNGKIALVHDTVLPGSDIKDLSDSVHGLVGALYAIGGEDRQFLHPNSPNFGQDPK